MIGSTSGRGGEITMRTPEILARIKLRGFAQKFLVHIFNPEAGPTVELNSCALQTAYEDGLDNQDGLLENPYIPSTNLYIAWEMGSRKRQRRDMTVW